MGVLCLLNGAPENGAPFLLYIGQAKEYQTEAFSEKNSSSALSSSFGGGDVSTFESLGSHRFVGRQNIR